MTAASLFLLASGDPGAGAAALAGAQALADGAEALAGVRAALALMSGAVGHGAFSGADGRLGIFSGGQWVPPEAGAAAGFVPAGSDQTAGGTDPDTAILVLDGGGRTLAFRLLPAAGVPPRAALIPGIGLCADHWGAAIAFGSDIDLMRLTPARRLVDRLQMQTAPLALREMLRLAMAERAAFGFMVLSAAGIAAYGAVPGFSGMPKVTLARGAGLRKVTAEP